MSKVFCPTTLELPVYRISCKHPRIHAESTFRGSIINFRDTPVGGNGNGMGKVWGDG